MNPDDNGAMYNSSSNRPPLRIQTHGRGNTSRNNNDNSNQYNNNNSNNDNYHHSRSRDQNHYPIRSEYKNRHYEGIGEELVPDSVARPFQSYGSATSSSIPIASNNTIKIPQASSTDTGNNDQSQDVGCITPGGSDQYLPDLEFNINPETALSPTLGLTEHEWKAIPFSTRRKLKAAVQNQYSNDFSPTADDVTSSIDSTFTSLPSSVVSGNARPMANPIPFSKRRERSSTIAGSGSVGASAGAAASSHRSFSASTDSSSPSANSPAFQFLSKLGNPSTDVTTGSNNSNNNTNNGGYTYQDDLGEQVGDYIIGKLIGYGGFSQVKEAHTIEDGKKLVRAVKIVSKFNSASTAEHMERIQNEFDHEVAIWKTLHHEFILRLLSVQETPRATYCFTEKIGGGTLFDAVKNNRATLEPDTVKQYVYQLGSALLYLHETVRVVHRDVKLENCLLDDLPDGTTKVLLCDFGMSEYYELGNSDEEDNNNDKDSGSKAHTDQVIGPSDTSSLFNQYHYHRGNHHHHQNNNHLPRQTPAAVDRNKDYEGGSITRTLSGSSMGAKSPGSKSPGSGSGSGSIPIPSGLAALTPLNDQTTNSSGLKHHQEDPLTSHHSRHHHHHLDSARNSPSSNNNTPATSAPHTPSSTPNAGGGSVRGWASPAQAVQSASASTTQNFGSLPYACPQLLTAAAPIIEPSVDMWSFGVVIHALYMGFLPWNHAFLPKLRMMILNGQWDQAAMEQKAGFDAMEVTRACLEMDTERRATIRQVMEHRFLRRERAKYGPKGRRMNEDELQEWSRADND